MHNTDIDVSTLFLRSTNERETTAMVAGSLALVYFEFIAISEKGGLSVRKSRRSKR